MSDHRRHRGRREGREAPTADDGSGLEFEAEDIAAFSDPEADELLAPSMDEELLGESSGWASSEGEEDESEEEPPRAAGGRAAGGTAGARDGGDRASGDGWGHLSLDDVPVIQQRGRGTVGPSRKPERHTPGLMAGAIGPAPVRRRATPRAETEFEVTGPPERTAPPEATAPPLKRVLAPVRATAQTSDSGVSFIPGRRARRAPRRLPRRRHRPSIPDPSQTAPPRARVEDVDAHARLRQRQARAREDTRPPWEMSEPAPARTRRPRPSFVDRAEVERGASRGRAPSVPIERTAPPERRGPERRSERRAPRVEPGSRAERRARPERRAQAEEPGRGARRARAEEPLRSPRRPRTDPPVRGEPRRAGVAQSPVRRPPPATPEPERTPPPEPPIDDQPLSEADSFSLEVDESFSLEEPAEVLFEEPSEAAPEWQSADIVIVEKVPEARPRSTAAPSPPVSESAPSEEPLQAVEAFEWMAEGLAEMTTPGEETEAGTEASAVGEPVAELTEEATESAIEAMLAELDEEWVEEELRSIERDRSEASPIDSTIDELLGAVEKLAPAPESDPDEDPTTL